MLRDLPAAGVLDALLEALESAGLGCAVIVDRGDRFERAYANEAMARICGVDLETYRRMPVMDLVAPEERSRLGAMRPSLDSEATGPSFIETKITLPDGSRRPVELALGHALLEGARATFCFMRDGSAQAQMAEALRESETRFRQVAEASRDSITVVANGKYIYGNPVALQILGLRSADEIRKVDPWSRVPPERRGEMLTYYERLERGEAPSRIENRVRTPDGREVILESSLSLTTMGGAPAIISFTRDITERMQLQAELVNRDRLASVGLLAAGVAHELNNPLTSLGLQARRLREDADRHGLPAEMKQAIEQIDEGARRMSTIIGDLLFMARPVGQPQAHVDVAKILTSTVALVRAGAPRSPRVDVDLQELPPIRGFASKLGQVFLNVLKNAIQALEGKSDGAITILGRVVESKIEIVIEDDGSGIPEDVMPRVSQPFFTTKPDGTGLGLWISQTLVGHHGGTLTVANREKGGTRGTIRLPVDVTTPS